MVSAVTLQDTLIQNTVSNVSINITSPIYFDQLIIGDDGSIYFSKLRSTDLSTETLTFNITQEANITFYGAPIYFTSSSNTEKHIASNLSGGINTTIVFNVLDCDRLKTITYTNGSTPSYSCTSNIVTIPTLGITSGSSSLALSYYAVPQSTCGSIMIAFLSYPQLVGLLGAILFIGTAIILIFGFGKSDNLDMGTLTTGVVILMGVGILIIIALVFLTTLCSI